MDIEIWSDIACPWCYIGKRRFEAALAAFEHRDQVTVAWRSFELDPDAPAERKGELAARLAQKYGMTLAQARESQRRLTDAAAAEGLEFRFEIARSGNTFDGHRLVHIAARHDLQDAMKERLLRAYFTEGELIADHDTLARLAAEVGLPADEVRAALAGDGDAAEVRGDERDAATLGISAVPTFVVDRAIGVSGAQAPAAMLEFLREGWARRAPVAVAAGGEACGADGCG
ncbi:MAG: DsbA family oxidoreductase [Solirubrobacteraceae bacterium]|jgi:predicted DsbA family dithiol-disulfide isomerase